MNYSLRIFHFIPGSSPSLEPVNLWDGSRQTLPAFIPSCSCPAQLSEGWGLSWEGDKMQCQQWQPPLWRNQCPIGSKGAQSSAFSLLCLLFNDSTSWVNLPVTETLVHNMQRWSLVKVLCDPNHQVKNHIFFIFTKSSDTSKAKIAVGRTSSVLSLTEELLWRGKFFQPERSMIVSNRHLPWTQV